MNLGYIIEKADRINANVLGLVEISRTGTEYEVDTRAMAVKSALQAIRDAATAITGEISQHTHPHTPQIRPVGAGVFLACYVCGGKESVESTTQKCVACAADYNDDRVPA